MNDLRLSHIHPGTLVVRLRGVPVAFVVERVRAPNLIAAWMLLQQRGANTSWLREPDGARTLDCLRVLTA